MRITKDLMNRLKNLYKGKKIIKRIKAGQCMFCYKNEYGHTEKFIILACNGWAYDILFQNKVEKKQVKVGEKMKSYESKKLNALLGKKVEIEFEDGLIKTGILSRCDDKTSTGYPFKGYAFDNLYFKKSHIVTINEVE